MNRDKALIKTLKKSQPQGLPYGFNVRAMRQVLKAAEQKERRLALYSLIAVTAVSVLLAAAGVLLIRYYFNYTIDLRWPNFSVSAESAGLISGILFIGTIVLVLLVLDLLLRKLYHKMHREV